MSRKTLITIIIGVLAAVLIGLTWWWFFGRGGTQAPPANGTFGSGGDRTLPTAPTGPQTNIPGQVQQTSTGGNISGSSGASGGSSGGIIVSSGSNGSAGGAPGAAPGVDWLAGGDTGGSISGGSGVDFNPAQINQLNNGQIGGQVSVLGTGSNTGSPNNSSLTPSLIAAGIGTALCTTGLLGGVSVGSLATGAVGAGGQLAGAALAVPVNDIGLNLQTTYGNALKSNDTFKADFLDCITRTIAKAALQQLTASIVNWINSGFNGKPSFVTNYQQFFSNVANQAAGAYIQGSALSFLCSPFQLKVKIAIAQSYAQRNAQSCTLSQVIGNIKSFANGNFNQGGWAGLLQFTTVPTNNPYGAFAYAQIGLQGAQQQAVGTKQQDLLNGQGFLSYTQPTNCSTVRDPLSGNPSQKCTGEKIVTPGKAIESSLSNTLNVSQSTLQQAGVSGSFDAIISALISQLASRALYSGLSNLSSGPSGLSGDYLTPDQQQAQTQGNQLLTSLQGFVTLAQQYGQSLQGSISDIEAVQQQLSSLENCWLIQASSTALTASQQQVAANNAASADQTLHSFDAKIAAYNDQITHANSAIAALQDFQTRTLGVSSTADVRAISADLSAAQASGLLISQNDVTQAQQDRSALQANLNNIRSSTEAQQNQCNAYGQ